MCFRAACQAFCRLFRLKLASLDDEALGSSESLAERSHFPPHPIPLSSLTAQQKRPYFFGRCACWWSMIAEAALRK